jgi:hypothetical protein
MNPTWLFVGAVYALAVWLGRRAAVVRASLRWRVAGVFYALVLVFLFRPMTQDYVSFPADIGETLPPWSHDLKHARMSNPDMSDITLQIVPWAEQVREQWRTLRVPLWNERNGSGYPLLANGQSSAFSPLRLVTLPLSLGNAFTAEAALKILLALTFTFLFLRRRSYDELPSAIGAISFGFCTFLQVWLHFPLVTVAAMLPLALFAIDLIAERPTYGRFAFAALTWAVMLFGGHPETVSHITFLGGLYLLWVVLVEKHEERLTWRYVRARLGAMTAAGIVAAFIALPLLLPMAEAIPRSKRFQELKVQPHAVGIFSDWPSKIVLFQPNWYGQLPKERARDTAASPESITGFAGILGVAAFVALGLRAIVQRRFREREFFFVLATPIVYGIIVNWPVVSDIFHALFRLAANARLRLLFCFLLSAQAAAILDIIRKERAWHYLAGVATTAWMLLHLIRHEWFPGVADKDTAMIAIIPSMLVLLVAALVPLFGRWKHFAMMPLAVVIVAELWNATDRWNPTIMSRQMYHSSPLVDALGKLRGAHEPNDPFRIVGMGAMFFPNLAGIYGYEDIRAHDPMSNGRYLGVLRLRTAYDPSRYFAKWTEFDARMLDFLNVRYVLADVFDKAQDTDRFQLRYEGKDGRIYENMDALPRFFPADDVILEFRRERFIERLIEMKDYPRNVLLRRLTVDSDRERTDLLAFRPAGAPKATVEIEQATPTDYRLRIAAPRHSLIASSVPIWPGWKVERDGKALRVVEINGAFIGFVVPPGTGAVRVFYDPLSFKVGLLVSLATLLGLAAPFAGWQPFRRRAAAARG